jgi:hypothetical protein
MIAVATKTLRGERAHAITSALSPKGEGNHSRQIARSRSMCRWFIQFDILKPAKNAARIARSQGRKT